MGGRYFYPVDRYRDLMAALQARYSSERVGFLVCSDAALRLTDFPGPPVTLGSGVAIEDPVLEEREPQAEDRQGQRARQRGSWVIALHHTPLPFLVSVRVGGMFRDAR
jgi:hypothetical protein